jgi:glycosyltransferase involved in cell wall biosynthesis
MIKNFEAMACGCILCAWDHGEAENRALGFVDMGNFVLYRDVDELTEKIARLRAMPERMKAIAAAGQALVEREYRFDRIGGRIVAALASPLRPNPPLGFLEWIRLGLRL